MHEIFILNPMIKGDRDMLVEKFNAGMKQISAVADGQGNIVYILQKQQ